MEIGFEQKATCKKCNSKLSVKIKDSKGTEKMDLQDAVFSVGEIAFKKLLKAHLKNCGK